MWLMTSFGFFSVVRKADAAELTVRARTRGDLERLRGHYLPELGPSLGHAGTDYPWRATVAPEALKAAMGRIVDDLDYANFKNEVSQTLGPERAKRYAKVWTALYDLPEDLPEPGPSQALPWPAQVAKGKALAWGGVVVDQEGHFLLREVANHFDGYVWSFAKGQPQGDEAPQACALRAVQEETGAKATILSALPGEFVGGTTLNRYFLMVVDRRQVETAFRSEETADLCWADADEARRRIGLSTNQTGLTRDLGVLYAALSSLPHAPPLRRRIALRTDWKTRPLPAARKRLPLGLSFNLAQMAGVWRGFVPSAMEEKWFAFFEDGVLHLHRSWTGFEIYRVHFQPAQAGWEAVCFEVSRRAGEYDNTDDREDREQVEELLLNLLVGGLSAH